MFGKAKQKRVILGLDGVPYDMLKVLAENGTMPGTAEIISKTTFSPMQSSMPHVSSVAWSSMITGKNPGEHGIFGFTELNPQTYEYEFPNYTDLKAPPFWETENNRKSVIINVPSTYPVRKMNGVHIAGFVAPELKNAVYPSSLLDKLMEIDYRADVDSMLAHDSIDNFLEDLDKTLEARVKAYRYLWESQKWDTFMLVITETDRLCHFLYAAYLALEHKYHSAFIDFFKKLDQLISEIYTNIPKECQFIMLSDHGFELSKTEISLNRILIENGFLELESESNYLEGITASSKAFFLDPNRLYIHSKDKYIRGSVKPDDKSKVLEDITSLFKNYEIDGEKVVKQIFTKEDIYSGEYTNQAPDLVLLENPGFDLKAAPSAAKVVSNTIFTGKHTFDDAFILSNPQQITQSNFRIENVVSLYN